MKNVLKSSFVAGVAVCVLMLVGIVFAEDVIVQEGDVDAGVGNFDSLKVGENVGDFFASVLVGGDTQNPMSITEEYVGIFSVPCVTTSSNGLSVYGMKSAVLPYGTGNYSEAIGIEAKSWAYFVEGQCSNVIGGKFYALNSGCTVTNCYGVYIAQASGATNNWALYDATSADSCLNSLSIGSTSAPSVELDVTGDAKISDDLDVDGTITMDKLVLPTGTSDPSSPVTGQVYINTSTNKIRAYYGGSWHDM